MHDYSNSNGRCSMTDTSLVLVTHSTVSGRRTKAIRSYTVGPVKPYAQYDTSVSISFVEPRQRRGEAVTACNGSVYYTIEQNGRTVFDTRSLVSVDMEEFEKTRERIRKKFEAIPAMVVGHR
jgi:hypothetical protein